MQIKVNILNMKKFFETVNQCKGAVNIHHAEGWDENINRQYGRQKVLLQEFEENGRQFPMTLNIAEPRDYFDIVAYYAGDC